MSFFLNLILAVSLTLAATVASAQISQRNQDGSEIAVNSPSSQAQDRIIKEDWILADPTVSRSGQWMMGASVDYLRGKSPVEVCGDPCYEYDASYDNIGFSIFAGHGNTTIQYTYRPIKYEDIDPEGDYNDEESKRLHEVRLRHLLKSKRILGGTPYLLLG